MTSPNSSGVGVRKSRVPISSVVGMGRSIIALAQASILLFSDVRGFFVPVGEETFDAACSEYLGQISLFCRMPSQQSAALVAIFGLLIVASGVLPRYTCFLHAYVSVSLIGVLSLPDGGDLIATNLSLLLIFAYIGDPRMWHWGRRESRLPAFRGISKGAQIAIRVQVAFIYFDSATAKLAVDTWADGTQMYYVTRQEMFGASGPIGDIARELTSMPVVTLASSWGAIAIELGIAVLIFIPTTAAARVAIVLSSVLHILIIVIIGLGSFGLIMVGVIACAVGSRFDGLKDLIGWDFWASKFNSSLAARSPVERHDSREVARV